MQKTFSLPVVFATSFTDVTVQLPALTALLVLVTVIVGTEESPLDRVRALELTEPFTAIPVEFAPVQLIVLVPVATIFSG